AASGGGARAAGRAPPPPPGEPLLRELDVASVEKPAGGDIVSEIDPPARGGETTTAGSRGDRMLTPALHFRAGQHVRVVLRLEPVSGAELADRSTIQVAD